MTRALAVLSTPCPSLESPPRVLTSSECRRLRAAGVSCSASGASRALVGAGGVLYVGGALVPSVVLVLVSAVG